MEVYRSFLGWFGMCSYTGSVMDFQHSSMPFHLVTEDAGRKILASTAILGLKCMERGFLDDLENTTTPWTLEEWKNWYRELVSGQIDFIADHYRGVK